MKLALSNIAWRREDDAAIAALMREHGVGGVEIAPTALWEDPLGVAAAQVQAVRDWWEDHGAQVVALQALLFGRPELTIFQAQTARRATLEYLTGMMDLAAHLGARAMVFGSPKNRLVGELDAREARRIALEFFGEVGKRAAARDVVLCIEPNPRDYGCDFVNTTAEGLALVQEVGSPGFGLHLDAGALTLNRENIAEAIAEAAGVLQHFHASDPGLVPLGTGGADHAACAGALREAGYESWVSVEMRPLPDGLAGLRRAVERLRAWYGG